MQEIYILTKQNVKIVKLLIRKVIIYKLGNINFKKSLESFKIHLECENGNINAKRFALSGQGNIFMNNGDLDLKAVYVD